MTPFAWPQVGQIVRHPQSNRVVKIVRVGDSVDARTATATDAHPDFLSLSPVDFEQASNEDRARFLLAEAKVGKVFLTGRKGNDRRFTVTLEKDIDAALETLLKSLFDGVTVNGKAADVLLREEVAPVSAEAALDDADRVEGLMNEHLAAEMAKEAAQPADPDLAETARLIAELQDRLFKTAAKLDEAEADNLRLESELSRVEKKLEDAQERELDLLEDLHARDLRAEDVAEMSTSNGHLAVQQREWDIEPAASKAALDKREREGWMPMHFQFDGVKLNVVYVRDCTPAPKPLQPAARAAKLVEPVGSVVSYQIPQPPATAPVNFRDIANARATLRAMLTDMEIKHGEFTDAVNASPLPRQEKADMKAESLRTRSAHDTRQKLDRIGFKPYPRNPLPIFSGGAK